MFIFYKELDLETGFEISAKSKHERLVGGREVSTASGIALFTALRGRPIRCWSCGCVADRWISCRGRNDISRPVLNLFATRPNRVSRRGHLIPGAIVMMTRDHIIPRSLGGNNDLRNLRPGCETCNGRRGNKMSRRDQQFMQEHPELRT